MELNPRMSSVEAFCQRESFEMFFFSTLYFISQVCFGAQGQTAPDCCFGCMQIAKKMDFLNLFAQCNTQSNKVTGNSKKMKTLAFKTG